jgi:hypothetical protein
VQCFSYLKPLPPADAARINGRKSNFSLLEYIQSEVRPPPARRSTRRSFLLNLRVAAGAGRRVACAAVDAGRADQPAPHHPQCPAPRYRHPHEATVVVAFSQLTIVDRL